MNTRAVAVLLVLLVLANPVAVLMLGWNSRGDYLLRPGDRLVGVYVEKTVYARRYTDKTMDNLAWNTRVAWGSGEYGIRIVSATLYRFEPVNVSGLFLNIYGEWVNDTVSTLDVENTGINYNYSVSRGSREIHRLLYWTDPWNSKAYIEVKLYHYTYSRGDKEFWKEYYLGLYSKYGEKLLLVPADYRATDIMEAFSKFMALANGAQGIGLEDVYHYTTTKDDLVENGKIAVIPLDYLREPVYFALKNRVEGLYSPDDVYVLLMDKPLVAVKVYNTTGNWTGENVVVSGRSAGLFILLNLTRYYLDKYNITGHHFYKIVLADIYVPDKLVVKATLRYRGIVGIVHRNKTVTYGYVDDVFDVYSRDAKIVKTGYGGGKIWEKLSIPLTTLELNARLWQMIARHYDLSDAVAVYIDETGLTLEKARITANLVIRAYKIIEPIDSGAGHPVVDALVVKDYQSDPTYFLKVYWDKANNTWFSVWMANLTAEDPYFLVQRNIDWNIWSTSFSFTLLIGQRRAVPFLEIDIGYKKKAPLYGYYDSVKKIYVAQYAVVKPTTYMFTVPLTTRKDLKEMIGRNNTRGEWYGYIVHWGIPAWKTLPNASQVYAYDVIKIKEAPRESAPVMMATDVKFTKFSDYITDKLYTIMKKHYYYDEVNYIYEYSLSPYAEYEETLVFYPHRRVLRFVTIWEDYGFVAEWFKKLTGQESSLIQGLPVWGVLSSVVLYDVMNTTSKQVIGTYRGGVAVPLESVLFRIKTGSNRYFFMVFVRIHGVDMEKVVEEVRAKLMHSGWYTAIEYDEEHEMIVMATRVSGYEWRRVEDYSKVYIDTVMEEWFPGTSFWIYNSAKQLYEPTFIIDKGKDLYMLWHYTMHRKDTGTDVVLDIDESFKKYMEHFKPLWDTVTTLAFYEAMGRITTIKEIKEMSYREFNISVTALNNLGYKAKLIGEGEAVIETPVGKMVYKLVGNETAWSTVEGLWNNTMKLLGAGEVEPLLTDIERQGIYMIPFLLYLPLYPLYEEEYEKFVDLAVTDFKYVYPRLYAERVAEFLFMGAYVTVPRKCYIVPVSIRDDGIEAYVRVFDPVLNMTVLNDTLVYQEWKGMDAEYKAYVSIMLEYKPLQVHVETGNGTYDYILMPHMSYMGYVYPLVYVPPDMEITNTSAYWDELIIGEPGYKVMNRYIVASEIDVFLNTTLIGRQYLNATLELEDGTVLAFEEPYTKLFLTNMTYALQNGTISGVQWMKMPEVIQGEYGLETLRFNVFANYTILMDSSKAEQHLVLKLVYPGGGRLVYVLPIRYVDLFPSIYFVGKVPQIPGTIITFTPEAVVGVLLATVFIYMLTGGRRKRNG